MPHKYRTGFTCYIYFPSTSFCFTSMNQNDITVFPKKFEKEKGYIRLDTGTDIII